MINAVKLINLSDETAVIGGYGVVFGGKDLDGETFTKDTDLQLGLVPQKQVFYDHSLGDVKHALGFVLPEVKIDGVGVWIQAQLDRSKEYVNEVLKLVEKGILGWSSGTAPHLARRENGIIKSWPVIEFSLTPTPAEPRTIGVERLKTLLCDYPDLETAISEAEGKTATATVTDRGTDSILEMNEVKKMSEITEDRVSELAADIAAKAVKAALDAKEAEANAQREKEQHDLQVAEEAVKAYIEQAGATNTPGVVKGIPAVLKNGRGDNFGMAFKAWIVSGDKGGLNPDGFKHSRGVEGYTLKASNATDMNIGTAADGGNLVPTGFYNQIIAKRNETMLAARLPIFRVPGVGTTVDVPFDNEADGEFVATAEAATFDKDAPAVGKKSLTLALYSKYTDVSYQLLDDTPANLMSFLADFVGRGMAKTHNNLLLTEVASNGTNFKTFASATAIAFGEPEDIVGNDDLSAYLEDDAAAGWVMRSATHWDIKSIVGSDRQYAVNGDNNRTLLGYPVFYSQKAAAVASAAKSIYFGNWRYVAMREAPGITFIRDPYTASLTGQVRLLWHFRTVYGVLQAEAIGYGTQAV